MKNMRQTIVDGIEQVYKDATAKGDTNMEVIRARGSEDSLNDRITKKADQSFVDSQLASIVSGAPKGTFATLVTLKTKYPNGTDGVFLVLETGNWYYWNASALDWELGGLYQAVSWDEYTTEEDESWVI